MSEFNLVPEEFRQRVARRRIAQTFGVAFGALLLVVTAGYFALDSWVSGMEQELSSVRAEQALSRKQADALSTLQSKKHRLELDLLLLKSLRSGAAMPELVQAVETALPDGEVRFESWQFLRAGIRTEGESVPRPPSYFIRAQAPDAFPSKWESLTHMTIRGEAVDHAALSRFVQRLFAQPDIDDVRIQRSSRTENGVSFNLAVVLKSMQGRT